MGTNVVVYQWPGVKEFGLIEMRNWLKSHKFESQTLSFLLMVLPPAGMYYAAQIEADGLIWGLLALVVSGNLLAVALR